MKKENDREVGIRDATGELYMLNKKERRLTKGVLLMAIGTEGGRKFVMERFGKEGLRIPASLLQGMGTELGKTRSGSQKVFDD